METSTLTKFSAIGVFIIIVTILFWGFAPRGGDTISFEIDTSNISGFSILNSDGLEKNAFAQCFFKIRNELTDSNGNVLQSRNSQFYVGSPSLFSLQDARDDRSDSSGFNVKPRIRCEGNINKDGVIINTRIIIESYKLKIDVYSQNSKQELIHTYTKQLDSFVDATMEYGQEYQLFSHRISPTQIFSNLDAGKYDTWQEFRVSGEIIFYFEELKSLPLTMNIPDSSPHDDCKCSPRTYFLVQRDTVDPNSGQPSPGGGGVIIVIPDPEPEEPLPDNDGTDGVIQTEDTCDPPEFPDFNFECVTSENAIWLGLGLVVIVAIVSGGHHVHRKFIGMEE